MSSTGSTRRSTRRSRPRRRRPWTWRSAGSRAANHSRLWLGCSALLAAGGGERGRRAAENGLASIALTSAVVNLVPSRSATGAGPRGTCTTSRSPARSQCRAPRPGPRAIPRPPSPSPVVSVLRPQAGIPLSVVASLVAYSRVHTGVHYPSDTIAGTASGVALAPVAVAALERRRWRVDVQGSSSALAPDRQKCVTTAHSRGEDPRPMTPRYRRRE